MMTIIKKEYNKDKFDFKNVGDWNEEPDLLLYLKYGEITCRILRNGGGALCGYVLIKKNNKYYDNAEALSDELDVHGGITYSNIEKDNNYWIGFDCSHYCDYSPVYGMGAEHNYKNISFIKGEIDKMVDFIYPMKSRMLSKINEF